MSNLDKIVCPKCKTEISLDQVLVGEFEEKYKNDLEREKKKLWAIAQEKATEKAKGEIEKESKLLKEELEEKTKKLRESQEIELTLRKEKNRFEEDKKTFELEKQRQIDAERAKIKEETAKTILDEHRLKDAEKNKLVSDMRRQIEELRRKSEQGSQQTQGEVLEVELEESLKLEFPIDEITPVPKGINGADVIQIVCDSRGRRCGSIAWEMKRTKAWVEEWVQKLKDDQRKIKAELSVLISEVLPKGIKEASFYNGIYVATPKMALSLAIILRRQITEIAGVMALEEGKSEKKDIVYNYLLGSEFRGRIESFIEAAVSMRKSLDTEKRAYTKIWAEREKLIGRIETSMVGLYGEVKGIAGNALPEIKSLELPSGEEMLEEAFQVESVSRTAEEETVEDPIIEKPKKEKPKDNSSLPLF